MPSPPQKLPLWATDMYHAKLSRKNRSLTLILKLSQGPVVLDFHIPHHVPLDGVKFSRPTIQVDSKGRLGFNFTGEKKVETPNTNPTGWLGIDPGIIQTCTAAAVTPEAVSQSWSDSKQVQELNRKINTLKSLRSLNYTKVHQNKDRYDERANIQRLEAHRLGAKITKLKVYRAHLIANKMVQIAMMNGLGIALENLAWVPNSHWEQGIVQRKIMDEAVRHSVPVKKVNARNTSKVCSRCGGLETSFSGRTLICKSCDTRLDRDVNASRNIALRALRLKSCPPSLLCFIPNSTAGSHTAQR